MCAITLKEAWTISFDNDLPQLPALKERTALHASTKPVLYLGPAHECCLYTALQ